MGAIKNYPLQFTQEELDQIQDKAWELGMTSKKEFIYAAIKEKLEKED
jgi:hypothetical protein